MNETEAIHYGKPSAKEAIAEFSKHCKIAVASLQKVHSLLEGITIKQLLIM